MELPYFRFAYMKLLRGMTLLGFVYSFICLTITKVVALSLSLQKKRNLFYFLVNFFYIYDVKNEF